MSTTLPNCPLRVGDTFGQRAWLIVDVLEWREKTKTARVVLECVATGARQTCKALRNSAVADPSAVPPRYGWVLMDDDKG
jgi:hypothetical protein